MSHTAIFGSLLSGVALALAFPKPDVHILVWVALVPLLVALQGVSGPQAWWLGLLCGVVYRAGTLYWLVPVMTDFGDLPLFVAVIAAAALIVYLASFVGVWALVAARLNLGRRGGVALLAAVWVGLEQVEGVLLGGFPWTFVGYAAGRSQALLQVADLAGVLGLGYLAILVNGSLALLVVFPQRAKRVLPLPGLIIVGALLYGAISWAGAPPVQDDARVKVTAIQGNVEQREKWEPSVREALLERHLRLTREALERGAKLVVWPETSWPDPYGAERNPRAADELSRLARTYDAALLVGTTHLEEIGREVRVFNSAVLIDGDGAWKGRYDKEHLVPFGEYVPAASWLSFLGPLVTAAGRIHPGPPDQEILLAPRAAIRPFGVAICYEIIFPELVRRQVVRGAEFLVTITNDAWYGTSSGTYQHFAMARVRAVENRRYLVRAANTGISGIIDPWGRVLRRSEIGTVATVTDGLQPRRGISFYTRAGGVLAWLWMGTAVATCVWAFGSYRRGWTKP